MAGESAREVARRQREKAARLARSAELWERGASGEEATASALETLRADGWQVWHDVAWPGRPRANIDHVVIGTGGVFVIDSKHWSGTIAMDGDVLRQNGRSRESAVHGAAEGALAITRLLGDLPATGVLCFVREERVSGWARDVMICSTATLVEMLRSRPPVLHPMAVQRFASQLDRGLRSATVQRQRVAASPDKPSRAQRSEQQRTRQVSRARRKSQTVAWPRLVFGAALIGLMLVAGPQIGAWVGGVFADSLADISTTEADVGDKLVIRGTDGKPGLEVTVTKAKAASRTGANKERPVVVRVKYENIGPERWVTPTAPQVRVQTSDNRLYRVASAEASQKSLTVPVGRATTRRVTILVPGSVELEAVQVRVGPTTLTWSVN
ncbi:NERD domain-containing protein [Nocardioides sp. JQ2195]|uniref:nuclease-related domain-containing protein n=1 Tax=Nocardioides sp. JQ2195 TaxID=2592334 RepID=UPI00143E4BA9|nr:nuclease-related domain-containing protein [Nocardioides sp. JQ2195]QIX27947.1 NERD domain-containing protein [Nocardioides sp. JQ2195]